MADLDIVDCVNQACPWSGELVQADSLTEFEGHVVGFCNPGCRDKFETAIRHFAAEISQFARVHVNVNRKLQGFWSAQFPVEIDTGPSSPRTAASRPATADSSRSIPIPSARTSRPVPANVGRHPRPDPRVRPRFLALLVAGLANLVQLSSVQFQLALLTLPEPVRIPKLEP